MRFENFFRVILLLVLVGPITLTAQELIADPGFEIWDGTTPVDGVTLSPLLNWYNVAGTPDHHHVDNTGLNLWVIQDCPNLTGGNGCGEAYEGDAVLGSYKANGDDGNKEWAGTQLLETMQAGNCYHVSYAITNKKTRPGFIMATNQWGVFFSKVANPIWSPTVFDFSLNPNQYVTCQEMVSDSTWYTFEYEYVSDDDYEYAFVGYVGNASEGDEVIWTDDFMIGHYAWFDEVHVIDITPTLTVSSDAVICAGDSVFIEIESNTPIEWTDGKIIGNTNSFWYTPSETSAISVVTLDTTSCTKFDTIDIELFQDLEVPFGEVICISTEPFDIDETSSNGTWSGTGIIDASMGTFDPSIAGIGVHEVIFISSQDCKDSYTAVLEVGEPPAIFAEASPIQGCDPLQVNFNIDDSNILSYTITADTNQNIVDNDSYTYTAGTYFPSVLIEFSQYCTSSLELGEIEVSEKPVAGFTYDPNPITRPGTQVEFTSASIGEALSHAWYVDSIFVSANEEAGYVFDEVGFYDVKLFIQLPNGCTDSIVTRVQVLDELSFYIPNIFTPNNDGVNDKFVYHIIGRYESVTMEVYDRWGSKVFSGDDINEPWDGRFKNSMVQAGVYSYLLTVERKEGLESRSGSITVLK